MLNREKIWHKHLTDLSTSPVRSWEIKQTFFNIIIHILQKKTNSNCCTAAVAVYLLLLSASYYLHSPSTASGARYTGGAINSAHVAKHGLNFSTSWCIYYATDQCRKRLEACINSKGGHSEHLLWHCLSDIPVVTQQLFSEPPTTTHN